MLQQFENPANPEASRAAGTRAAHAAAQHGKAQRRTNKE
jgi:hypothetical protein